ncbi:cytochrome P450 [Jimgerdemannia flammicorona]|uniref:Cytochrome P450 n=1 Tax=Jimgerdemannia flammicorona TaxID=994334 RepID=A0A433Q8L9_9FUNG|nr:cytochrome P450 [Jimgerdemannia flammicorona]
MQTLEEALVQRLHRECKKGVDGSAVVDIWDLISKLAVDMIGEACFGVSFRMVETGNDHPLPNSIAKSLVSAALFNSLPILHYIPFFKRIDPYLANFVLGAINERRTSGVRRYDILQLLLDMQQNEDFALTDEEIRKESMIFFAAGSETTGNTTSFTVIDLVHNPACLAKLRQELDDTFPDPMGTTPITHDACKALPYLNAVLNEGMRLHPVTLTGVTREPDDDFVLGPYALPKGTIVVSDFPRAQTNTKYWGEDAKQFNPDRFLPGKEQPTDAFYPFSGGTRNCIGKNFAWMEMRLTLAHLLRRFDIEFIPGQNESIVQFITVRLVENKYNIRVRPRTL